MMRHEVKAVCWGFLFGCRNLKMSRNGSTVSNTVPVSSKQLEKKDLRLLYNGNWKVELKFSEDKPGQTKTLKSNVNSI